MLIGLAAVSGFLLGVLLTCLWGLRRARRNGAELLLIALTLLPLAYFWGADARGWPTPGSIAESSGLLTGPADRALSVGTTIVTAVVVLVVLVKLGATRRLERWSRGPGSPAVSREASPGPGGPPEEGRTSGS